MLPNNTMIVVTPVNEITSKKMKEGDKVAFQVVSDVVENGQVIIPRGSPVAGTISWRTGKGIGGKSAKFDDTFDTVNTAGKDWKLRGTHRQEGKGNTTAALLGSMLISGRSAVMTPGHRQHLHGRADHHTIRLVRGGRSMRAAPRGHS